jgi:hypothetical protein
VVTVIAPATMSLRGGGNCLIVHAPLIRLSGVRL